MIYTFRVFIFSTKDKYYVRNTIKVVSSRLHKSISEGSEYFWLGIGKNAVPLSYQFLRSDLNTEEYIEEYLTEFKEFSRVKEWEF